MYENKRLQEIFEKKKINSRDRLAELYNKAQQIRVYLSYYVNKLGDGDTEKQLSVGSTTYFKEEPEEALKDLLERNAEDLKILKRAIPIFKIITGGKRKKSRRNKRKIKRKHRKTKNKRKAKKKTKNKRKRKHRKTKKR